MKKIISLLLLTSCASPKTEVKTTFFEAPKLEASTKVNLQGLERFTLKNGLAVIAVPRKDVPSVQLTLAIKVGDDNDPLNKSGLASFVAEMLTKGTKKRTAEQLAEEVDFVGASLTSTSTEEWMLVSCHARSIHFTNCLNIMSDVVQSATFPQAEIDLVRQQLSGSIRQTKDSPAALAQEHAKNLYYGNQDVRGLPMTEASLSRIQREDLVEFHKNWFSPHNAVLAVSGDFDAKKIAPAFAAWKRHSLPQPMTRFLNQQRQGQLKIRVVDKPEATQSTISIIGPGIAHRSPDYFATMLMSYTLGAGGFSSRLMQVVRSEGGKTYGASCSFSSTLDDGVFTANTFTRNSETAATLKLLLGEIERMQRSGPTAEELVAAKGNIVGGFGLALETGASLATRLIVGVLHQLGDDYVANFPQRIQEVTLEQARKAAEEHLKPTALVIVGNAKEVGPLLTAAGFTNFETLPYLQPLGQ